MASKIDIGNLRVEVLTKLVLAGHGSDSAYKRVMVMTPDQLHAIARPGARVAPPGGPATAPVSVAIPLSGATETPSDGAGELAALKSRLWREAELENQNRELRDKVSQLEREASGLRSKVLELEIIRSEAATLRAKIQDQTSFGNQESVRLAVNRLQLLHHMATPAPWETDTQRKDRGMVVKVSAPSIFPKFGGMGSILQYKFHSTGRRSNSESARAKADLELVVTLRNLLSSIFGGNK